MNPRPEPIALAPAIPVSRSAQLVRALAYVLVGIYFGIILVKGQVADWFRIQEMFRLHQFHMFGIIGSAILTAMLSIWLLRRLNARSTTGETISVKSKTVHKGQLIGGFIFGLGWAATGACPGPLYAQIGSGAGIVLVTLASAVAGAWIYGWLKPRLPH